MLDTCLLDNKLYDNTCDLYLTPEVPGALYFNGIQLFGGDCCSCNLASLSTMDISNGPSRQLDTYDRQRYHGRVIHNDRYRDKRLTFTGTICSCNQCDLYKKIDTLKCMLKTCGTLKYSCCTGDCTPKSVLSKPSVSSIDANSSNVLDGTSSTWTGAQLDFDYGVLTPLTEYSVVWGGLTGAPYDIYTSIDGINYTLLLTNTQGYNNGITNGSITGSFRYIRIIFSSPVSVREVYLYKMVQPSCELITREWKVIWTNTDAFLSQETGSCNGAFLELTLEFMCFDPFGYDPNSNINEAISVSNNISMWHEYSGCVETPVDITMIFDTAVVSSVKIAYNGRNITIAQNITSGDILMISGKNGKVYINGTAVSYVGQVPYINTSTQFDFIIQGVYNVNITIKSNNAYI